MEGVWRLEIGKNQFEFEFMRNSIEFELTSLEELTNTNITKTT